MLLPHRGCVDVKIAGSIRNEPCRNADIENFKRAAAGATRHQQMAGFGRHERHRVGRNETQAPDFARPPVYAGWQVHGEDRYSARIHLLDDCSRLVRHIARKPCPEKCVDDDITRLRPVGVEGSRYKRKGIARPRGVALQHRRVAERKDGDACAGIGERGSGDIAIAAVVARAAKHHKAQCFRVKPQGGG